MISIVKLGGWTDDIETLDASQITALDQNLVKSIDGDGGGTYTPSSPITIGGAGIKIDKLNDSTLEGQLELSGESCSVCWRYTTLGDSDHNVGPEYDEYHTVGWTAPRVITVRHATGSPLPLTGNKIRFRFRHGASSWSVKDEAGTPIISGVLSTGETWVEIIYNGTLWMSSGWGTYGAATVTPVI